jgi:hypothetical protein
LTGTLRDRQGYLQAHCETGKDIDRHTVRQARILTGCEIGKDIERDTARQTSILTGTLRIRKGY